jgi:hypothetical protein
MVSARLRKKMNKKLESKLSRLSTSEIIAGLDVSSEDIMRLKVTVRKGARIESIPLKKLDRLATKTKRYWKFEDGWLILVGIT